MSASRYSIRSVGKFSTALMVCVFSLVTVRQEAAVPVPAHHSAVVLSQEPSITRVGIQKDRKSAVPARLKSRSLKAQHSPVAKTSMPPVNFAPAPHPVAVPVTPIPVAKCKAQAEIHVPTPAAPVEG